MEGIFVFLYPLVAIATVLGYLPQIHKLIIATRRPQNVSLLSWVIWFFSSHISFGYASLVMADFMLGLTAGLNAFFITVTTSLIIYNNYIRFEDKVELKEKIVNALPDISLEPALSQNLGPASIAKKVL